VVVSAPRDPAVSNPQALYRPDDPQLVGRIVSFEGATASYDGDAVACDRILRKTRSVPIATAIGRAFPRVPGPAHARTVRPSDLGMRVDAAAPVIMTTFRCPTPRGRHGVAWEGATSFPVGGRLMALSLVQDALLILEPVAGPVRASFDCAAAASIVERTICGDRVLAGWDRSVAAAYRIAGTDRGDQRSWLKTRDRCGADRRCLQVAMALRVADLLR
jgi:hypothetical protein